MTSVALTREALFHGGGDTRAACRGLDWSGTTLGAVPEWPIELCTMVRTVMSCRQPMMLLWGPELVQIFNDAFRDTLGDDASHLDALGVPCAEHWREAWPEVGPRLLDILSRGDEALDDDPSMMLRRSSGTTERWWRCGHTPVFLSSSGVGGILVVCHDATTRVLSEHERDAMAARADVAHARAAKILDRVSDAHMTLDAEFRILTMNAAAQRILQLPMASVEGRTMWEVFPNAVGSLFETNYRLAMRERLIVHFATQYVGEGLDLHVDVDVYPTDDGGLALFWRDRTAHVSASQTLADLNQRYRALLSSIDAGFAIIEIVFDTDAKPVDYLFVETNAAFEDQTGLHAAEGRRALELVPSLEQVWVDTYAEVSRSGRSLRFQQGSEAMGRVFDVFAVRVGEPQDQRVALLFTDITEARRAAREREELLAAAEQAREQAESANRAKSEFLTVMSHELRTPLNAIDGYAELMELGIRGPLTEEQRHDLARIRKSERHLLGLINGVLNYAQVEAGAVRYELEDVPVEEILATCEALTMPQVRAKGLTLRRDICAPSLMVRTDREKVQQVLLNLLSNAVKFTDAGGQIRVRCSTRHDRAGHFSVIEVHDTGIGIAANQLGRIFEPFVQVDAQLTRTREGTGLGLAISRDLARGLGGELTASSVPERGSTFSLLVPLAM